MSTKDATGLVVGGEPRIDFLPPEVKAGKKARKTRRSLAVLVVLVLVACAGGYVFATSLAVQSQLKLAAEQAVTQQLLSEQAEYAEARTVANQLASTMNARLVGSATEIEWRNYLTSLQASLPSGVVIQTFAIDSQSALESAPVPSILLQQPRVAAITFTASAPSLPKIDQLLVRLRGLTGFADAAATTISLDGDTYFVDVILNVNSDALEKRHFAAEADVEAEVDASEAPESEAKETDGEEEGS
jgi:hypothetical protein